MAEFYFVIIKPFLKVKSILTYIVIQARFFRKGFQKIDPVKEIVTYLETLFEAGENVGYVTQTWETEKDGKTKYLPTKGCCDRTAGELIKRLGECNGDIGAVFGDYKEEAGAWIDPLQSS